METYSISRYLGTYCANSPGIMKQSCGAFRAQHDQHWKNRSEIETRFEMYRNITSFSKTLRIVRQVKLLTEESVLISAK